MSEVKRQWKEREEISISELEDMWFANRNLEMARSIIWAVKDFQKITQEEKLAFLNSIFREQSNLNRERESRYISGPLLDVFLFLLPEWEWKIAEQYTRLIFILLSNTTHNFYVSAGRIKKFVHSYLNSLKKEDMIEEHLIVDALINNRMFEEMVNYSFISNSTVGRLWNFVFNAEFTEQSFFRLFPDFPEITHNKGRIRELLLSWDKVENRHALSVLWTLLAKRGDLEKIFCERQIYRSDLKIPDPDPNLDPTRIISG